mmetsp:Transcript_60893/g.112245  ORF Transcript_60893/g.112245 Transcript_60893/m.112245 type:complete len:238 (+) Transcript_60893:358-1071(+)
MDFWQAILAAAAAAAAAAAGAAAEAADFLARAPAMLHGRSRSAPAAEALAAWATALLMLDLPNKGSWNLPGASLLPGLSGGSSLADATPVTCADASTSASPPLCFAVGLPSTAAIFSQPGSAEPASDALKLVTSCGRCLSTGVLPNMTSLSSTNKPCFFPGASASFSSMFATAGLCSVCCSRSGSCFLSRSLPLWTKSSLSSSSSSSTSCSATSACWPLFFLFFFFFFLLDSGSAIS